jgi:hypothetical protein
VQDKHRKDVGLGLDAVCLYVSVPNHSFLDDKKRSPNPSERRFKSHWPLSHRPLSPNRQTNRRKKHTATVRLFVHGLVLVATAGGLHCRKGVPPVHSQNRWIQQEQR